MSACWSVIFYFLSLKNFLIYLFVFGCAGSALLCAGFSPVAASGGSSALGCVGWSLRGPLLLQSVDASSCGSQARLLHSTWNLPGPGIAPVSPALAGEFFNHWTTRGIPGPSIFAFLPRGMSPEQAYPQESSVVPFSSGCGQ